MAMQLSVAAVFSLMCVPYTLGISAHAFRPSAASAGFQHPTANFCGLAVSNNFPLLCPSTGMNLRASTCVLGNPMRRMQHRTVLSASAGENEEEAGNTTASSFVAPGLPTGLRPIGVDDLVENIEQVGCHHMRGWWTRKAWNGSSEDLHFCDWLLTHLFCVGSQNDVR